MLYPILIWRTEIVSVDTPAIPVKRHYKQRRNKREVYAKICEACGNKYNTYREEQKYCTIQCAGKWLQQRLAAQKQSDVIKKRYR